MYLFDGNRHTIFGKKVEGMEKAKRRVRICLLFVVVLAIVVGIVYYYHDMEEPELQAEGTLVYIAPTGWEKQWQM